MALPMNATPVYNLKIPSTGKDFKYRPFLVREEKALLIAQQSEDNVVMLNTVKDVIKACAKTDIDIEKLASFDIEYIFLKLRAVSVGEEVDLVFRCDTCEDEEALATVRMNLNDAKVKTPEGHQSKIPLFGDCGVAMKYPSLDTIFELENSKSDDIDQIFEVVSECIDYIYTTEEVFYVKEQSKAEVIQFLENLNSEQFDKIQQFFRTMPALRMDVKYTCPVCKKEHNKYMEGLRSFF